MRFYAFLVVLFTSLAGFPHLALARTPPIFSITFGNCTGGMGPSLVYRRPNGLTIYLEEDVVHPGFENILSRRALANDMEDSIRCVVQLDGDGSAVEFYPSRYGLKLAVRLRF